MPDQKTRPHPDSDPLLLLGGTFDPPHFGHLVLAECARVQFGGARVLFLPAGEPYRKAHRTVSAASDRVAMVRLATEGNDAFHVDEREVRREGRTYTVDTLEELRAEGHEHIVLLLGEDAVADMPHWHEPARIRELAKIAFAPKLAPAEGASQHSTSRQAADLVVDMPLIPISSTLIRQRMKHARPIRYLVPDAVERYIRARGLYP